MTERKTCDDWSRFFNNDFKEKFFKREPQHKKRVTGYRNTEDDIVEHQPKMKTNGRRHTTKSKSLPRNNGCSRWISTGPPPQISDDFNAQKYVGDIFTVINMPVLIDRPKLPVSISLQNFAEPKFIKEHQIKDSQFETQRDSTGKIKADLKAQKYVENIYKIFNIPSRPPISSVSPRITASVSQYSPLRIKDYTKSMSTSRDRHRSRITTSQDYIKNIFETVNLHNLLQQNLETNERHKNDVKNPKASGASNSSPNEFNKNFREELKLISILNKQDSYRSADEESERMESA